MPKAMQLPRPLKNLKECWAVGASVNGDKMGSRSNVLQQEQGWHWEGGTKGKGQNWVRRRGLPEF